MVITDPLLVPEATDGVGWEGQNVLSSNMWIARSEFDNPEAFLRSAILTATNPVSGDTTTIFLAREVNNHIVVARELFTEQEWRARLPSCHTVDLRPSWEKVNFLDSIVPNTEARVDAWNALKEAAGGTLELACGKGKTVLALKKIAQRGYPAVVIMNNEGLIEQWFDRAQQFLHLTRAQVGVVQGKKAEWDRPLVLAMIQTLANKAAVGDIPLEVRTRFGTVVFDECHHLSAATFIQTAPIFFGERYGLTATVVREDGLQAAYFAHLGRVFYSDLEGELTSRVFFYQLETKPPVDSSVIKDKAGQVNSGRVHKWMETNRERNFRILLLLRKLLAKKRKVLVLTHGAEHPGILRDFLLDQPWGVGYKVGVVTGDTKSRDRFEIIEASNVTFATFGVAKEGLDVQSLDTIVFATPFKAWGGFQQGRGRIERSCEGKKEPAAIVLEDYRFPPAKRLCASLKRSLKLRGIEYRISSAEAQ